MQTAEIKFFLKKKKKFHKFVYRRFQRFFSQSIGKYLNVTDPKQINDKETAFSSVKCVDFIEQ